MYLLPNETVLIGETYLVEGKVCKGSVFFRIEQLISASLIKIKTDESGWNSIYQDPNDSRYWELSFPESHLQGEGVPVLKCVDSI